eukprot:Tbor_TRINITY_DN2008_c0_g1::TRINITY_DN2008_c0_g1_i1::g.12147::m.12147
MLRRFVCNNGLRAGVSTASLYYTPRIRESQFLFEDVLNMYDHFNEIKAEDCNKELVDTLMEQSSKMCTSTLFPCYTTAGDTSCVLKDGKVTVPKEFHTCYDAVVEGAWVGISSPVEYGGQGLPPSVGFLARDMMATANWSFMMYPGLSAGCLETLKTWGSDEQKETYLHKLTEGKWSGTMCLTEPHCGTDLGQIKTKAIDNGDGTYKVNGTKIFISAGDHDMTENIIHIVLAKLPGAPEGTKGISLFVIPRHIVKKDGTLETKRNVVCTGLETKMGIKGNATCQMTFEDSIGYIIGKPNEGMKEMFTFMNTARIGTAIQGVAHSELAFQNALIYARERGSMRALGGPKCPEKIADPIINHSAVRNNIMFAKSIAEGGRCLIVDMCRLLDKMSVCTDAKHSKVLESELGFLTPIAKAVLTELGTEASLQCQTVFGGHGYIKGNGMEQIVRDSRIATLYEGTTIIQSLDFIGRKVMLSKINEVSNFGAKINALCRPNLFGKGDISAMAWRLWIHQKQWKVMVYRLKFAGVRNRESLSSSCVDFLMASGYLTLGYYWLRMAVVAQKKVNEKKDPDGFYKTKVDTAMYFFAKVLPRFGAHMDAALSDVTIMTRINEQALDLV